MVTVLFVLFLVETNAVGVHGKGPPTNGCVSVRGLPSAGHCSEERNDQTDGVGVRTQRARYAETEERKT